MDFELNEDQQAILEAVTRLLEQRAGPQRAIELNRENDYDHALDQSLADAGFMTIARDLQADDGVAGLEAALVVEAIARCGGVVAAGNQLLVASAVCKETLPGPVALCTGKELREGTPLRFGAHANTLLILDDDELLVANVDEAWREAVPSSFGYPMGRIVLPPESDKSSPGGATVEFAQSWWRLALAVEATGTMEAALGHVVDYLGQRKQFGRHIGSFQAVQHRLAECAIQVEASRWLSREAAFCGAPQEMTAAAAAFALHAADLIFTETHQLSGAIGFTHEFDLHVWSMRLLALRQELEGVGGARRALVEARWGVPA